VHGAPLKRRIKELRSSSESKKIRRNRKEFIKGAEELQKVNK
jgi:hypothetical protein